LLEVKKHLKIMQTNGTSKSPEEMRAWYFSEISKGVGYSNKEICVGAGAKPDRDGAKPDFMRSKGICPVRGGDRQ